MIKNTLKGNSFLYVLFSVILISYVLIRAYSLSFVHDESLSFFLTEGDMRNLWTANNHILNTILIIIFKILFGKSELALRLPNVLSFLLYLGATFYIFRKGKNIWLLLLGVSLIAVNPFLIEFFSLARGYGISLAFMLVSVFFILKTEKYASYAMFKKDFITSVLFAVLAVGCSMVMVNFLITVILIFILKFLFLKKENKNEEISVKNFSKLVLISCIPLVLSIAYLLNLKMLNQLYFGASSFEEWFTSIIHMSIYFPEYDEWIAYTIKAIIILFLLLGILLMIKTKKINGKLFYMTLLIGFLSIGLLLEHVLFGAKLPKGRTALFCIPILAVYVYYLFLELITEYKIRKPIYAIIILCLISPLYINFFNGINLDRTKTWEYDADTKKVMQIVKKHTYNKNETLTISNNWLFEPTINYYINRWELPLNPANKNGVNLNCDFIYRLTEQDTIDTKGFNSIYSSTELKSELLVKSEN